MSQSKDMWGPGRGNMNRNGTNADSKCIRCGYCCKWIVNILPNTPQQAEWAMARGFDLIDSSNGYLMVRIPHICPHLKQMKSGKYSCTANPKPEACVVYPRFLDVNAIADMGLSMRRAMGHHCAYKDEFVDCKKAVDDGRRYHQTNTPKRTWHEPKLGEGDEE